MKSEPLVELIRTLSPGEKRHFTRKSAGTNYLELFLIIDKMGDWSEKEVRRRLSNPVFAKNLSFGKNYLYHQILDALRDLGENAKAFPAPSLGVSRLWSELDILQDKGLVAQALKLIARAKKYCRVYHLDLDALKFMMVERNLLSRFEGTSNLKKLDRINAECIEIHRDLQVELGIARVYENIFVQWSYRRKDNPKLTKAVEEGIAFFERNKDYLSGKPSFHVRGYYHYCLALQAEMMGDNVNACKEFGQVLELYDLDQRVKMAGLERYIRVLKSYFNNLVQTASRFTHAELQKFLSRLQTIKTKDLNIRFNVEFLGIYSQLLHSLFSKEYERAITLERPAKDFFNKYGGKLAINTTLNFYYNLGLAFNLAAIQNPSRKAEFLNKSLDWLNEVEQHPKAISHAYTFSLAKVLLIANHIDLNALELASNKSRAFLVTLREQKKTSSFEYLVVSTFKKVLSAKIPEKKKQLLELLKIKLADFPESEPIYGWLDQKIREFS